MDKDQSGIKDRDRIELTPNRARTKYMLARGMPNYVMRIPPYPADRHVTSITSELPDLKVKHIPKKRQITYLKEIRTNPFKLPYLAVISSDPNDLKAKLMAAVIMEAALAKHMSSTTTFSKNPPLWHTLIGGFDLKLADEKPSLLIISNVTSDSTPHKIEKLRDLLETHHDIPRIVIATGTDPVSLMNSRVRLALNYGIYITSHFATGL